MNKAEQQELQQQIDDRDEAIRVIGLLLRDASLRPRQRMDRALGVVRLYGVDEERDPANEEAVSLAEIGRPRTPQ